MTRRKTTIVLSSLLIHCLLLTSLAGGQMPAKSVVTGTTVAGKTNSSAFLIDESQFADPSNADLFQKEAFQIVKLLSSPAGKSPVLIDDDGSKRDLVVPTAAARFTARFPDRKLVKVDWNALYAAAKTEPQLDEAFRGILKTVEMSKGKLVLYLDDITSFSRTEPMFGFDVAERLDHLIADGKLQVVTAASVENFKKQIEPDTQLDRRFTQVIAGDDLDDSFAGDKLSPDLRDIVAGTDPNQTVRVILQSDDINDPQLRSVLARNKVQIQSQAEGLDMMVLDLPARLAEAVAEARGTRHLSLDRQLNMLGHIETTTGTKNIRTIAQGLNLGLLGTTVLNTSSELDGTGIGIAIVDSSIREDHRSFVNASGTRRVVQRANFTNECSISVDEFGHGTHVASLAAGGAGANLNLGDGTYISNYEGIASGAKIINVRVLDRNGVGTSASLISALNWILANRATNNIRVVNLSLGAPAIESWRNDPLCRAVRMLTAAGIVVVAAAGNNGKTVAGQKLYGAIHSPGNDPTVITVGASNTFGTDARNDDGVTTYSSRGPTRSYWTDDGGNKHFDNLIKPDL
ncbi:MAG TPA: S8 family serine peptidase, partial [Pyrinomonadaceae bacterium]